MSKRDETAGIQIVHEVVDSVDVVRLYGQFIGGHETDELRSVLQSASEQQSNMLVVNLGSVTYLNSTSLGVLISAHASFVKRNGRIALSEISKPIEHVFGITKLDRVFEIFSSEEQALKSFIHS
jgi:anti-sigma B factor antagonist